MPRPTGWNEIQCVPYEVMVVPPKTLLVRRGGRTSGSDEEMVVYYEPTAVTPPHFGILGLECRGEGTSEGMYV